MFKALEFLIPKNRYFSKIAEKVNFCCVSNKTVTSGFKYAAAGVSVYAVSKAISVALEVQKQNQNFILQKGWLAHEERKLELLRENQKHLWDHAERGAFTEKGYELINQGVRDLHNNPMFQPYQPPIPNDALIKPLSGISGVNRGLKLSNLPFRKS